MNKEGTAEIPRLISGMPYGMAIGCVGKLDNLREGYWEKHERHTDRTHFVVDYSERVGDNVNLYGHDEAYSDAEMKRFAKQDDEYEAKKKKML